MPSTSSRLRPIVTIVVALLLLIIALPQSMKQWAPSFLSAPALHLGLDLAGGTELDFRISEDEIAQQLDQISQKITAMQAQNAAATEITKMQVEQNVIQEQQKNVVEAIRTVLERRINGLGVSEATITPSYIGNEKHLLVECPGVIDVQKCIDTVGKTIQLEFKEEFTQATKEYEQQIRDKVAHAQERLKNGESLKVVGQDINGLGISYVDDQLFFKDQLPEGLATMWTKKPADGVVQVEGSITSPQQDETGKTVEKSIPGIFLSEVTRARTETGRVINNAEDAFTTLAKEDATLSYIKHDKETLTEKTDPAIVSAIKGMKQSDLKTVSLADGTAHVLFLGLFIPGQEQAYVHHILVAYKGANSADPSVTRSKEEALQKAKDLKTQLQNGADFEELARKESDGPSKAQGGKLEPFGRGATAPLFEQVAFIQAPSVISDPVETPYGYHLIRVDQRPTMSVDQATYDELIVKGDGAQAKGDALITRLQNGNVKRQEEAVGLRTIFFSLAPTGWKDTTLDGKHFRSASVSLDPTTNLPVVRIIFDDDGAKQFQELTKNNIGKRIAIFVGGQLVSAPRVQTEIADGNAVITGSSNINEARKLAQDLNTGSIPAPIYLSGQRTIEATLGDEALNMSLSASLWGAIIVCLYLLVVYRLLGVVAIAALAVYSLIFFVILKLPLFLFSHQYIVLTLAGIAGMILSIGMSIDLNILIFERMKEELRKGKHFKTAAELGFERAWSSIRDANLSTLITSTILFSIGTSIVRGFAATLAMGVLVSLFTGVTVTRWLVRKIGNTSLAEKLWLFGVKPSKKE